MDCDVEPRVASEFESRATGVTHETCPTERARRAVATPMRPAPNSPFMTSSLFAGHFGVGREPHPRASYLALYDKAESREPVAKAFALLMHST